MRGHTAILPRAHRISSLSNGQNAPWASCFRVRAERLTAEGSGLGFSRTSVWPR